MAASLLLKTPPASPPAASAVQRPRESKPMVKLEPQPRSCRRAAGLLLIGEPGFDLKWPIEPRISAPLAVADGGESKKRDIKDRLDFALGPINPASTPGQPAKPRFPLARASRSGRRGPSRSFARARRPEPLRRRTAS